MTSGSVLSFQPNKTNFYFDVNFVYFTTVFYMDPKKVCGCGEERGTPSKFNFGYVRKMFAARKSSPTDATCLANVSWDWGN